jgi:hypothetical protein
MAHFIKNIGLPKFLISLVLILFLAKNNLVFAQNKFNNPIQLSNEAQFSILTIDRADEQLFQAFGHICIYLYDPISQLDRVYSYGTFDFSTENFYWKFITGQLPYQVSASNLQYTLLEYSEQYENRSVLKQELVLSQNQKQKVFDILEENLLPENRTYQYKFFQDNCSTRIRDVFQKAMGDSLKFSAEGIIQGKNFRYWMNKNLPNTPWARFGMNLAIGNPSDKKITNEEAFYIPDNLRIAFNNASNGGQRLVRNSVPLFSANRPVLKSNIFDPTPSFVLTILFIISLIYTFWQRKYENKAIWFDISLLIITGLIGLVIVFLWFFTQHGVTQYNWNLLWAWPTHLIAAFLLKKGSQSIQLYIKIYLAFLLFALIFGSISGFFKNEIYPQGLSSILSLLVFRLASIFNNTKNQGTNVLKIGFDNMLNVFKK